jgi:phosphatidylglycerophosphate synthase
MDLHRATRSDWSNIPPQQHNLWQRLAAGSHGIMTPGNIISLLGALSVLRGLFFLSNGQLVDGIWTIFIGRLADILDGMVADYTKTKSPLGEVIDASVDKVIILIALFVLLDQHLLPWPVGLVMAGHALYNIGVSTVARALGVSLHPSQAGKLCAVFEWGAVVFYLFSDFLNQEHHSITLSHGLAVLSFCLFVIVALWSSLNYSRIVYYKQVTRS